MRSTISRRLPRPLVPIAIVLVLAVCLSARPSFTAPSSPRTIAADRFVDSVGINIHLHYNGTAYRERFPLIKARLIELGVRHVRDGLEDTEWRPYFDRHNELGAAGIKGTFITSPKQDVETWAAYPKRMARTFEAYEAPNEMDLLSKRADWVEVLRETMQRLHTLKSDSRVSRFPIYGPSLTSAKAYGALGDVSEFYDFANLHNYFAGRHPSTRGWGANGYGSIAWNLRLIGKYGGGKPVVTTETGYQDHPSIKDSVPSEVAGRYLPIVLLEQFRAGIVRTYLYELCDFEKSGNYGLLDASGEPKPAFHAVKSLLTLLDDRGAKTSVRDLEYGVENGKPDYVKGAAGDGRRAAHAEGIRHMAFQKRDGSYFVALWSPESSYDPSSRMRKQRDARRVVVSVPRDMRYAREHRWQDDGSRSAEAWSRADGRIPLTVEGRLVVVELAAVKPQNTD